jgi:hypothetical protein
MELSGQSVGAQIGGSSTWGVGLIVGPGDPARFGGRYTGSTASAAFVDASAHVTTLARADSAPEDMHQIALIAAVRGASANAGAAELTIVVTGAVAGPATTPNAAAAPAANSTSVATSPAPQPQARPLAPTPAAAPVPAQPSAATPAQTTAVAPPPAVASISRLAILPFSSEDASLDAKSLRQLRTAAQDVASQVYSDGATEIMLSEEPARKVLPGKPAQARIRELTGAQLVLTCDVVRLEGTLVGTLRLYSENGSLRGTEIIDGATVVDLLKKLPDAVSRMLAPVPAARGSLDTKCPSNSRPSPC